MFNFLRKNAFLIFLLGVMALGFFLRAYHFSDWLHFELDQSRDAKIINLAIQEGPDQLPLLGPKAAGSFLRLGPAFYYFKYLSALIFGNTPSGMAVIIMIFGVLALPAFYFLMRRYFTRWVSLALLLLFSTSLFLVMYSRFSWNPNAMPFFIIMTFYSLLRAVDENEKRRGWWLIGAAFFLSVATQLHFLAFVAIPAITIIFLIMKRPRIKWVYWIAAAMIVLALNFPVILNDIKTGGENFKEFKDVAVGKTNKNEERTLVEKIGRNYRETSMGHFLILSSQNNDTLKMRQKFSAVIACNQDCKKEVILGLLGLAFFTAGLVLLFKNIFFERNVRRKNFLIMTFVWLIVSFGLFVPLAFDISPRFWLISAALPFIFLGFSLEFLGKLVPRKIAWLLAAAVVMVFVFSNLYQTKVRFEGLRKAEIEAVKISADRILKERHRVTLKQQYLIMDYIESIYKQNGYPVYLNSDSFYRRSFLFHLDTRNIPRDDFRNVTNKSQVYKNGNYFLVYPTDSNLDKEINDYSPAYSILNKKQFGTLTVIRLAPKPEAITAGQQVIEPQGKNKTAAGVPKRYTWEEIFNESSGEDMEE